MKKGYVVLFIEIAFVAFFWAISAATFFSDLPLEKMCGSTPRSCSINYMLKDAFGPEHGKWVLALIWFELGVLSIALGIWTHRRLRHRTAQNSEIMQVKKVEATKSGRARKNRSKRSLNERSDAGNKP